MLTYLLRHGRTAYSAAYQVNGRPDVSVPLDADGRDQCCSARATLPRGGIVTCVVSEFGRTAQTAELLLAGHIVPMVVDRRLNEIDYGEFEGGPFLGYGHWLRAHGPWHRPPGADECQREAITRMLNGLLGALVHRGPRLVVAHGLLLSVVRSAYAGQHLSSAFFPEAPYVTPMIFCDADLPAFVADTIDKINSRWPTTCPSERREFPAAGNVDLARFNAANPQEPELSEGMERHA